MTSPIAIAARLQRERALEIQRYYYDRDLCRSVLARHATAQGRELVWGGR